MYVGRRSDTGEILSQMGAGDFFGEIGILNLDGGVNKYVSCSKQLRMKILLSSVICTISNNSK